jgi:acyl carrier protein
MDRETVIQGVIDCVSNSLAKPREGMSATTKIINDLGADSLDFLDIMFHLESKFSVTLQKEDFDLLGRLGIPREQALVGDHLTPLAKEKLLVWLPELPQNQDLMPRDLAKYVSMESVCIVVEEHLKAKEKKIG